MSVGMGDEKIGSGLKMSLADLTKIPAKEFEHQFQEWMERDDVARSLQAKLRADLITNFNKTTLGKHILAQTTSTTNVGYGGGSTQRLTLSPLVLALNTLVAEFLYAENCHFSLSVFCTEVPFRNTLPDFESMRQFRFAPSEIGEILDAVTSGSWKHNAAIKVGIRKSYLDGGNVSLLLILLKSLLERSESETSGPVDSNRSQPAVPAQKPPAPPQMEKESSQHELKGDMYNVNFRYLNKYLIILSKKVKEMTLQFAALHDRQQQSAQPPASTYRPHSRGSMRSCNRRSVRTRKFENLNRSLERITENLKQMSHAKRKSKHVGAIVSAIEGLATQFTRCALNFENVSKGLTVEPRQRVSAEKQTETEAVQRNGGEKTYLDWVHEMRYTPNGQKFLDRIEAALRKALNKQRAELNQETEVKLRHQKELLKIRYKQRLIEQLTKHQDSRDSSVDARKINENIEMQLKQFETKHFGLLEKLRDADGEVKSLPRQEVQTEKIAEVLRQSQHDFDTSVQPLREPQRLIAAKDVAIAVTRQPPPAASREVTDADVKDVLNTRKQLQRMMQGMTEQERSVNHIVQDAKMRLQELEHESNQLEQNFLSYLERQRLQKEATHQAAVKMWRHYAIEREKMRARSKSLGQAGNPTRRTSRESGESDEDEFLQVDGRQQQDRFAMPNMPSADIDTPVEYRNAIVEAKQKFFEHGRRYKAQVEREYAPVPPLQLHEDTPSVSASQNSHRSDDSLEQHFAKKRPGAVQSHISRLNDLIGHDAGHSMLHSRDQSWRAEAALRDDDLSVTSTHNSVTGRTSAEIAKALRDQDDSGKTLSSLSLPDDLSLITSSAAPSLPMLRQQPNTDTNAEREPRGHGGRGDQLFAEVQRQQFNGNKTNPQKVPVKANASAVRVNKTALVLRQSMVKMQQLFGQATAATTASAGVLQPVTYHDDFEEEDSIGSTLPDDQARHEDVAEPGEGPNEVNLENILVEGTTASAAAEFIAASVASSSAGSLSAPPAGTKSESIVMADVHHNPHGHATLASSRQTQQMPRAEGGVSTNRRHSITLQPPLPRDDHDMSAHCSTLSKSNIATTSATSAPTAIGEATRTTTVPATAGIGRSTTVTSHRRDEEPYNELPEVQQPRRPEREAQANKVPSALGNASTSAAAAAATTTASSMCSGSESESCVKAIELSGKKATANTTTITTTATTATTSMFRPAVSNEPLPASDVGEVADEMPATAQHRSPFERIAVAASLEEVGEVADKKMATKNLSTPSDITSASSSSSTTSSVELELSVGGRGRKKDDATDDDDDDSGSAFWQ